MHCLEDRRLITPSVQVGYVFGAVYLSVCLSVCQQDYAKSYQRILMKFGGWVRLGPRTNPLDFGSDPDADPDVITLYPECIRRGQFWLPPICSLSRGRSPSMCPAC